MRTEPVRLNVPTTVAAGPPYRCVDLVGKQYVVAGIGGGATGRLQGRLGPNDAWLNHGAADINANSTTPVDVPEHYYEVRWDTRTVGAATTTVTFIGTDQRD